LVEAGLISCNAQHSIKDIFDQLGTVAHACNPSYFVGRNQENHCLRPAEQKIHKTPPQLIKPGMMVYICHPSYVGSINTMVVQAELSIIDTIQKIPKSKRGRRCDLSGTSSA
jgi:hypothetical protein